MIFIKIKSNKVKESVNTIHCLLKHQFYRDNIILSKKEAEELRWKLKKALKDEEYVSTIEEEQSKKYWEEFDERKKIIKERHKQDQKSLEEYTKELMKKYASKKSDCLDKEGFEKWMNFYRNVHKEYMKFLNNLYAK
jgi:hypothetical protein